jgi:trans-aconitate 2-methyltransferase
MTEWDAASYARLSGLQKAMADEVFPQLDLKGNEEVLDVGCGDGKITALIALRVPRGAVIGVDPSDEMIAFASSHFAADNHPNLRFEVADARALPFRNQFDLVVSFNALHWVPDHDPALRSIRGAMKSNARAHLRLVTAGERKSLESVVEEVRKSPRWAAHFQNFTDPYLRLTAAEYAKVAEKNGLRILSVHTELKAWNFKSRSEFFDFSFVGLVAWTKELPESERSAFVNDVLDCYRAIGADQPAAENVFHFYQTDIALAPSRQKS